MATEKITVKECTLKKKTDSYTIYTVTLTDKRKGDCFTELKAGETYDAVIEDGQYGLKITIPKAGGGKFGGKGYSPNLKLEAMKLSVDLAIGECIKVDQLSAYAEKIHAYIKS